MSWTDERVELLKKMWSEGQSASQIAKELGGVTRNAVIGKVHPQTAPARTVLEKEGFRYLNYIDIFDGGPTLHARCDSIRSIAQSRLAAVTVGEPSANGRPYLVAHGRLQDFRAIVATLDWAPGRPVTLSAAQAEALGVEKGSNVRLVAV